MEESPLQHQTQSVKYKNLAPVVYLTRSQTLKALFWDLFCNQPWTYRLSIASNPGYSLDPCPCVGLSRSHVCSQMSIECLTSNRHFQLIERVLCHIVRVQFVHLPRDDINIRLMWLREQEKLRARKCLEARKAEVR